MESFTSDVNSDPADIGAAIRSADANNTLSDIQNHFLHIDAGYDLPGEESINTDTLVVFNSGGSDSHGELSDTMITGMGMSAGIKYSNVEDLTVTLASSVTTTFHIASTAEITNTRLVGNSAEDTVTVSQINSETTIWTGTDNATINVNDLGGSNDPGVDNLIVYGTNNEDFFLFRAYLNDQGQIDDGMISAYEVDADGMLIEDGYFERINYDRQINGNITLYGRSGDDTFVFDDTLSSITVYGDAGADRFQVGQVFKSPRDANNPFNGLSADETFETTQTTRGYLSNGVSESATMYGGYGDDSFTVYRNKKEI